MAVNTISLVLNSLAFIKHKRKARKKVMDNTPYFPSVYQKPECFKCEKTDCINRNKYQRDRRDFMCTSGRCPRLPDRRGFVGKSEQELYAATYPLVHAELGDEDTLSLTLTMPGTKRKRKVYSTKSGYWYFRMTDPYGYKIKRIITIYGGHSKQEILDRMERNDSDYCLFRCTIEDNFI